MLYAIEHDESWTGGQYRRPSYVTILELFSLEMSGKMYVGDAATNDVRYSTERSNSMMSRLIEERMSIADCGVV